MRRGRPVGSVVIVCACVLFFVVPLISLAVFSMDVSTRGWTLDSYTAILGSSEFWSSLGLSLLLAFTTTGLSLALMVPTAIWVHTRAPHLRGAVELTTLIVFAVPSIALVIGSSVLLLDLIPAALGTPFILVPFYVVLSFAFTYRSLDAGIRAIDVNTLREAGESLGANGRTILWRIILPNLRTSILGAAFLTTTVVLGEYVLASLFLYDTLPVYTATIGTSQAQQAAALALLTILFTWFLLAGLSQISKRRGGGSIASVTANAGATASKKELDV